MFLVDTSFSNTKKQSVVSILYINHLHFRNIPIRKGLYRSRIKIQHNQYLRVYVPGLSPCKGLSGIHVNCISDDSRGLFSYESVVHSIGETNGILATIDGYLFMHDDVVWDENINLNSINSRITETIQFTLQPTWDHIQGQNGYTALNLFNTISDLKIPVQNEDIYFGQSDFYFISRNDASMFFKIASFMRKSNLFLEIAIPMFIKYFSPNRDKSLNSLLKIFTTWDSSRKNVDFYFKEGCRGSTKYDYVHPIKFNTFNALEASLHCFQNKVISA